MTSEGVGALAALGWGDWQEQALADMAHQGTFAARIVRQEGTGVWVDAGVERFSAVLSGRLKHTATSALDLPVVGDWVLMSKGSGAPSDVAVVQAIVPRKSMLARRRAGTKQEAQLMAANVDLALIVWGLDRQLNMRAIDRAVVLARAGGVEPAVVLTKTDTCAEWQAHAEAVRARLPIPVLPVSVVNEHGIDSLIAAIGSGRTAALIGPSGAGKSSLVNRLLQAAVAKVGSVRGDDRKGRHTTTHRELFRLTEGGLILDGPGIREFGLWGDRSAVDSAFPDIARLAEQCVHMSCGHAGAAGCAVVGAVTDGRLDKRRLLDYLTLIAEISNGVSPRPGKRRGNSRWAPKR